MKEKINKILSSKHLVYVIVPVSLILLLTYTISGAVTLGQHIMFLFGVGVVILIIFSIAQNINGKGTIYNLNLALTIFWIFYFLKSIFF